jgi:hypothetical protein
MRGGLLTTQGEAERLGLEDQLVDIEEAEAY